MSQRSARLVPILKGALFAGAAVGLILFLVPTTHEMLVGWFHTAEGIPPPRKAWDVPAELIRDSRGNFGLRLSEAALKNLEVDPVRVETAHKERPLPPQMGTVNYDNDFLYTIRPRFPGEIISFLRVEDDHYPDGPTTERDVSFNDRVKQGAVLAVAWSKDLGLAKASLVDAIVNRKVTEETLERHRKLFQEGAIAEATVRQSEKEATAALNAYRTALYPLIVWKVPRDEIRKVEAEADTILRERNKPRNPEEEVKRWARVEIKAPTLARKDGKPGPGASLVVIEKNTHLGDFIDPGRDTPLFRLADLTRLQIWVHPPEELLPALRAHLNNRGAEGLKWQIRFQADPPGTAPLALNITKLAPSLDPILKTPMLIGELPNPDRKYLVGQVVSATVLVPPPPNTVEVPTNAVNLVENQSLVFVRKADGKPNEYFLRRVAVAQTAGKVSLVRSVLTDADKRLSADEVAKKRRPLEPLEPGDLVLTRGVVELTAALEDLQTNPENKRKE